MEPRLRRAQPGLLPKETLHGYHWLTPPSRAVFFLSVLLAVLALLVWLSVALSMMFLGLPFGALHLLLRWIGH